MTPDEQLVLNTYHLLTSQKIRAGQGNIASISGLTPAQCRRILRKLRDAGQLEEHGYSAAEANPRDLGKANDTSGAELEEADLVSSSIFPTVVEAESIGFEPEDREDGRVRTLEAEIEELRRQVAWLANSGEHDYEGGTLTLNTSDYHYHDRGHLIQTMGSLEDKCVELLSQFRPRKIIGLINGDVVTGRGIYRNQQLENVLPKAEQQIAAAVFRFWEFHQKLAPLEIDTEWRVVHGNHDFSMGDSMVPQFVWGLRNLGINASYAGFETIIDISDAGTYNVLVEHGYGNSTYNPTSNKMIHETLKKVLGYANRGYTGERRIRRVLHGHTHFLDVGTERAEDILFDVTGGLHRNDRSNIGGNTRPVGWIAYVSPPGSSEIVVPMEIRPAANIMSNEMLDPNLEEKNRAEAARCIEGFHALAVEHGLLKLTP